ncbi:hydroxymethylglutaryl-CoA lyase [Salinarimonas soli]|uniref:Hydroxymethylglutaryl-CoA lyase n=1 Tax=Salinarimonas soli TaxID=1638099 RepID=A0A5B2VI91_9HYPH|nr:hydroxymethylglutaryl-CoA lyase [Salinarimonas soli]KAA2238220.1 hydroxymethylglutaryl-CoA lyase [Salinarimonas soli]
MTGPAVEILDVTLRDGLQLLAAPVPLDRKLALLDAAEAAGVRRLEVGSFVSPRLMPGFADTADVLAAATARPALRPSVLVPNRRGFDLALAAGAPEVVWVVSASEGHNGANLRRTVEASLAELMPVLADARADGVHLRLAIATAFHCAFDGPTPHEAVFRILDRAAESGALREAVLADTIGHAVPDEARALFGAAAARYPGLVFGFHAHDTLGRGLANIEAAYEAGCRVFDGALAGLGGCPYAPGAAGNVSTEAVAALFEARGIATGLDAAALAGAGRIAATFGAPARVPPLPAS